MNTEDLKLKGNAALENERYNDAIEFYSRAIDLDPLSHILFSNRSAANVKKGVFKEALYDALKTISLEKDRLKGYFRKAIALKHLEKFDEALKAFD